MNPISTKSTDRPARSAKPLPTPRYWCVEINTVVPKGHYTFGPFESRQAAGVSRSRYVEDLCRSAARGIVALVKQYRPDEAQQLSGAKPLRPASIAASGLGPQRWF